jgi:hypothetical protein
MNDFLNDRIPQLIAIITKEIRSREDKKKKWAKFKRDNNQELRDLLEIPVQADVRAGDLLGFDIDASKNLILLNYTAQAHAVLHDVEDGWTPSIRLMRGLVYEFGDRGDLSQIKLASRGFEKFFNHGEMPETRLWSLLQEAPEGELVVCREKADGHMIEYFMKGQELLSTTRGKMGTVSSEIALEMFDRSQFIKTAIITSAHNFDLMTVVVELVHPNTQVLVDYDGQEQLFLLAAYDKRGDAAPLWLLNKIADEMQCYTMPRVREMTLHELVAEVKDRSVHNNEGWVASIGDRLVKFKYETYIGMMVSAKLSYKYVMRCIQNDRAEKMFSTLPEEVRPVADKMIEEVIERVRDSKRSGGGYKVLYGLHNPNEGGVDYFRSVCREFWREWALSNA